MSTTYYDEADLKRLARELARADDRRATRISWGIRIGAGGIQLLVFYRAGGEDQETTQAL